jgi:phage baseplate assembly protein V
MSWIDNLLRRSRLRGLVEGPVQRARVETHDADAKDNAERWQDYGFAAHPVDGQGLSLNWKGHTIVLRMDRLGERPELQAYEVSVWHKDGHKLTLKEDGVIEIDCKTLAINASSGVTMTTPKVSMSGDLEVAGTATAQVAVNAPTVKAANSLKVAGKEMGGHTHGSIQRGTAQSDGPT